MITNTYKKSSKSTFVTLIIMILCGFQFYSFNAFNMNICKLANMLLIPTLMLLSVKQIFKMEKDIFFRLMRVLFFSWVFSMIMAYLFWGQSIQLTYRASASSMLIVIFFYFVKKGITRTTLERIIIIFAWLYILLWIYSMSRAPLITFGWADDDFLNDDMSRGILRINFTGRLSLILGYFYYLNKSFVDKKPKFVAFAVIFFIFIVLQVTRQLILWTAVVTVIYIFVRAKKLAIVLAIFFASIYISSTRIAFSDSGVIGSLLNVTENQVNRSKGEEDIRVTDYKYFFTKWSKNPVTDIFGNGMPHSNSSYGKFYDSLRFGDGLFLSDVGYPCMYVLTGLLGLLTYLVLFIKGALQKMPKELLYVNMFMGFMIPANVAASWYEGADTELAMCICVYLIYIYRKNPQLLKLNRNEI